jgi:16S rRNA (guanine527-N7)-methyltransferase
MTDDGAMETPASGWSSTSHRVSDRLTEFLENSARRGFLGPMTVSAQVSHALGFAAACASWGPDPQKILDLGTGAGVPGLILAEYWPSSEIALLDANQRRAESLRSYLTGWNRQPEVQVVCERAEVAGRSPLFRERFDLVTARSFGPPAVTSECGAPLVSPGGLLVISEPPSDHGRWSESGLQSLELEDRGPFRSEAGFHYRVLGKLRPLTERFPRRTGVPAKRPLF